jgi:hypothetical protein
VERLASPLRLGLGSGGAEAAAPLSTPVAAAAAALVLVLLVFGSATDEEEDACGFCAAGAAGRAIGLGLAWGMAACMMDGDF